MPSVVIGLHPHHIPAGTIANGDLERAITEPLAEGRDEVIYLVCSHRRVQFGSKVDSAGGRFAYLATSVWGGMAWDTEEAWARITLPDHARPSALGWAILDPALESVEGLTHRDFDPELDPEGEDGRHRHELLPWIYDRHLELGSDKAEGRGVVERGEINFRLEYIGKAEREALRRTAGPHHKVPLILGYTLVFEPYRLVYFLPCELHAAMFEPGSSGQIEVPRLSTAEEQMGLPRTLLIAAAEEALIESLGTKYNERNTRGRRFPNSDAGERLFAAGIDEVILSFLPMPQRVSIEGLRGTVSRDSKSFRFNLPS